MATKDNKAILAKGNAAITAGNNEGFLSFCAEDTEWMFVGDKTLKGKEAVRQWMKSTYLEPPRFTVDHLIAEEDFLTAVGEITMKDSKGKMLRYSYCDVWQFRDGRIIALKAFVIQAKTDR